ncbi:ferritin subunit [Ceratina calcarata]|uniref:Ferritin n=1 Tax=Ceratina calcarata TaxID=156304 RepID=A0AAJ7J845_9HYME|nr:ferritin subunit [Ceratina calcarata]XP_026672902.1 ferritin subunit [Ceratina calcarata]
MFFSGLLLTLLAVASASEVCYTDVHASCNSNANPDSQTLVQNCNAKYGAIDNLLVDLQGYANAYIDSSFEFLLYSSYFGNYENQREGFKKLYRKFSDEMWEDAIDIIKFITKRGGQMNFNQFPEFKLPHNKSRVIEFVEIESLAKALDIQKQFAKEAIRIHSRAQPHTNHDASITHYIEEKFLGSLTERIRNLAGFISDLKYLLAEHDPHMSLFLFDEYLQKTL